MMSAARLPERIAPSMVAGRPVSVQSPARTRLRHLVTAPGRMASCAGVAAKVARRSRTICQGGSAAGSPVSACDLAPDRFGEFFARRVDQPIAGADGDREAARKGEQPLHRAVEHAEDRRLRRRRLDAEMGVDDGAEFGRHLEAGHQRRGDIGRHREDDGVVRAERDRSRRRNRAPRPARRQSAARAIGAPCAPRRRALAEAPAPARSRSCPALRARSAAGRRGRRPQASRGRWRRQAAPSRRGASMLSAARNSGSTSRS